MPCARREGLNQLMADVEAKRTNFTSLLVYDVSDWSKALTRFKEKIRAITRQAKGISIETTVKRLATYIWWDGSSDLDERIGDKA